MLTREQKQQLLKELSDSIKTAKAVVLVNYLGLKADEIADLRHNLSAENIRYRVVRNTLLRKILRERGIAVPKEILAQPLAVAIDIQDEVMPCKLIYNFGKEHEALKIVGGVLDNEFVDIEKIKTLAQIPGRDELEAKLVGVLAGPIFGLTRVLRGNLYRLVSVLKQYQGKLL